MIETLFAIVSTACFAFHNDVIYKAPPEEMPISVPTMICSQQVRFSTSSAHAEGETVYYVIKKMPEVKWWETSDDCPICQSRKYKSYPCGHYRDR